MHQGFCKSSLFDQFKDELIVVTSSLYVPAIKATEGWVPPIVVKPTDKKPGFRFVNAPHPVTGVRDSIGLCMLGAALEKFGIHNFELRHDPLHPSDKTSNLILIGSPTSNLVGEELHELLPKKYFKFSKRCDQVILKGVSHGSEREGMYGIVLRCPNPWRTDRIVVWLAGIGPTGTEASIRTLAEGFRCVPEDIKNGIMKKEEWVIIIKGVLSNGYVTDTCYVDYSYEL